MRNKSTLSSYFPVALILAAILFCFQNSSYADDITLKWASNTEPDLAGYNIYYKKGFSGPPYNGVDIDQGTSPISLTIDDPDDPNYVDPDNPEFLLTGLDDNDDYYLVVTATDNEVPYNESGFSNEVSTFVGSSSGGGSGAGESSSSGSCLIASCLFSWETDRFENQFVHPGKTAKYLLISVARHLPLTLFFDPFILSACIIIVLIGFLCGAKFSSIKTATST